MSGIERKILRNKLKAELKKNKQKRTMPLSKYRFKTQDELKAEYAEKLTEQMLETAKQSSMTQQNND